MKYKSNLVFEDMKKIDNKLFLDKIKKDLKIMITGCNGMIATYLLYYFLYLNDNYDCNIKVYAITRNILKSRNKFSDLFERSDICFIEHDVNLEFNFDFGVDYIYHLASCADPANILNNPTDIIKSNTIGTINVMEYAKKYKVKKVVFSSTREVYGKVDENILEVDENSLGIIDQLGVRACYPEGKKIGECIVNSYYLQHEIPYTILRIAHTYGPGMPISNDGRIMSDLINNVVNNESIVLKSDGSAVRGFCYLTDLISAILFTTFDGKKAEVYNVCNEDENISILDLAYKLVNLFPEKKLDVSYVKISDSEREAYCKFKRVMMNTDKLRSLGWMPRVKLDEGLKNTVNSFGGDN